MNNEVYTGWLRFYRLTHSIKSPVTYDEKRKRRLPLEEGVFEQFIDRITSILMRSDSYLDKKGIKMPKPLWEYDPQDESTWASSPKFAYGHLLKGV